MSAVLNRKERKLRKILKQRGSVLVAFSGGTDSTLLLKMAHDVLQDNVLAVIVLSVFMTKEEVAEAKDTAERIGARNKIVKLDVLKHKKINKNPANRCYFCKKEIMQELLALAAKNRISHVIDGSNIDDLKQYRPGKKALAELKIRSPLAEAGLKKSEIRELLYDFGFNNWDKPSSSCLATRFSYGTQLKEKDLKAVAFAEQALRGLGFKQVRVRMHGDIACIEVLRNKTGKLLKLLNQKTLRKIKETGCRHICLDVQGYRSGSMDRVVTKQ